MVFVACAGAVILGVPLGVVLLITRKEPFVPHPRLHKMLVFSPMAYVLSLLLF